MTPNERVPTGRSRIRAVEVALSTAVLLTAGLVFTPLSMSPIEPVAIWAILFVPALLGTVALLGSVTDGIRIASAVVGLLAVLTLLLTLWTVVGTYTADGGGVNFGPLFVLLAGSLLAGSILVRTVVRRLFPEGATRWLRGRGANL